MQPNDQRTKKKLNLIRLSLWLSVCSDMDTAENSTTRMLVNHIYLYFLRTQKRASDERNETQTRCGLRNSVHILRWYMIIISIQLPNVKLWALVWMPRNWRERIKWNKKEQHRSVSKRIGTTWARARHHLGSLRKDFLARACKFTYLLCYHTLLPFRHYHFIYYIIFVGAVVFSVLLFFCFFVSPLFLSKPFCCSFFNKRLLFTRMSICCWPLYMAQSVRWIRIRPKKCAYSTCAKVLSQMDLFSWKTPQTGTSGLNGTHSACLSHVHVSLSICLSLFYSQPFCFCLCFLFSNSKLRAARTLSGITTGIIDKEQNNYKLLIEEEEKRRRKKTKHWSTRKHAPFRKIDRQCDIARYVNGISLGTQ